MKVINYNLILNKSFSITSTTGQQSFSTKIDGLWCLMPLSTIFQCHIYWWRKLEYPEKTTNLLQVIDKHNVASSTPRLSKIRTHNFSGDRH